MRRCEWSDLLTTECADCRSGVHTGSYETRPRSTPVRVNARDDKAILPPRTAAASVAAECNYLLGAFDRLVEADWISDAMREIKQVWRSLCSTQGIPTVPKQYGACMTVTDAVPCTGKVVEDRNTGLPRCATCRRTYVGLDLVKLKIENERTA